MIRREIVPESATTGNGLEIEAVPLSKVSVYLEGHRYQGEFNEGEKRARQYFQYLAQTIEDDANFLDHGGAARVYTLGKEGGCVKVMKNRHTMTPLVPYDLGLAPLQEFSIMEKVYGLEVLGCRAPAAEMCIEGEGASLIVMEQLDAVNLQHVLNGTKELPDGFDYDLFFEALEGYIQALHAERGVVHHDLFPRNVMVDLETGLPYVIDFGRSVSTEGKTELKRRELEEMDWKKYDALFEEVDKLRLNEKTTIETIPLSPDSYSFGSNISVHYSKNLLQKVFAALELNPLEEEGELFIGFGKKQKLLVTRKEDAVRGAFSFMVNGVRYYIGRKQKDYTV